MDLSKLASQYDTTITNTFSEYHYLKDVTIRLSEILGEWLLPEECLALVYVICNNTFYYKDGFVINGMLHEYTIGFPEACSIASCFSPEPSMSASFLYKLHMQNNSKILYEQLGTKIITNILSNSQVKMSKSSLDL